MAVRGRRKGSRRSEMIRTTLALPAELLEATDRAVGGGRARSRNEFVARALRHELAMERRREIDASFAEMARDPEIYQEALQVAEEFAQSDWEAFHLAEDA